MPREMRPKNQPQEQRISAPIRRGGHRGVGVTRETARIEREAVCGVIAAEVQEGLRKVRVIQQRDVVVYDVRYVEEDL